ncbi:MAG: hypothetical protein ACRC2H_10390 [Silanimonas sp.]
MVNHVADHHAGVLPRAVVVTLAAALAAPSALAAYREELGLAADLDSGQPLYREQHLLRAAPDGGLIERLVVYRCVDGTPFARKRVDYRSAVAAPAFQFEDARSGYSEGVLRGDGGARVFVDRPDAEKQTAPLPGGALVADAGFDQWVRREWPRLTAGESVPMAFLVPSRLTSYDFKVYEVDADEADTAGDRRFRLRLGGLLGWFAPHIDVVYDGSNRRLLRFEGLSNLRDDAGEDPLKVRIEFPEAPKPADAAAFARLGEEPLRACRVGA